MRYLIIFLSLLLLCAKDSSTLTDKLYNLPRAYYAPKETNAEYRARMIVIRDAFMLESDDMAWRHGKRALRVMTLAIWRAETLFARDVHAGLPGYFGSDGGRAKCLGQLHITGLVPREEWQRLGGLDLEATRRCARATMRVIIAQTRACVPGGTWNAQVATRIFNAYATGNCSAHLEAKRLALRVRLFHMFYKWDELRDE